MRLILFCLVGISLLSCSGKNKEEAVIPKEKMAKILWDIIQADQFSAQFLKKDSTKLNVKEQTMKLYDEVFALNHVTREQFKTSYNFYMEHPDITRSMFDSLSARANLLRNEIYKHQIRPTTPVISNPIAAP
ncbi:MAG: DUF4296 domain-containing protein [Chitinophagales bacterium]